MSVQGLARLVGLRGSLRVSELERGGGSFQAPVVILDARESFGRLDVLVAPAEGTGSVWVSADRVTLEEASDAE